MEEDHLRQFPVSPASDDIKYDEINHLVIPTPGKKKRKKCAGEGCDSSIRTMCLKCNVNCCIECFILLLTRLFEIFHIITLMNT